MQSVPSLRDEALDFINRCAGVPSDDAVADFLATIRRIGFHSAACGAWAGAGKQRQYRFFFVDWPADWLQAYEANKWVEHDLLPIEARRRLAPFRWSEIVERKLSAAQRALYDAGWAYGWRDILAVPLHGPGSLQGLVTLAVHEQRPLALRELAPADLAAIELAARTIWEKCRTSAGFGMGVGAGAGERAPVQLSDRELECLQWAACGKSDADIAKLVGISTPTAHFHIEQAKKRLGVRSRVEAVAIGVLNGII